VALAVLVPVRAFAGGAQYDRYPVRDVPRADRIVVEYAGLPVTVRLAHVILPASVEAQARVRAAVEALVKDERVRVAYCPEAGLDPDGFPQVYVMIGTRNANEELVREGLVAYRPGGKPSEFYHKKMESAESAARGARAGIWASGTPALAEAVASLEPSETPASRGETAGTPAGGPEEEGVVYSELSSSMYHLPSCRWTARMSAQRRIRYKSPEAAERAGKTPCWICMAERAERILPTDRKGLVRVLAGKGPIVGCGSEFHAPNCERLMDRAAECTSYRTVKEAEDAGLAPCTACLRLSGMIPKPLKGECIGRAPPQRRPCRRAPADDSGLCAYCQGKGE